MRFALFYEIPVPRPWGPDSERLAYQQTIEQAERNARNLTEVLAAQTRENFHAIDQALLAIVERLQVDRLAEDSQIEPSYRLLFDSFRTVPNGVLTYFILDEDGRLLNSSRTPDRE